MGPFYGGYWSRELRMGPDKGGNKVSEGINQTPY